jgi:hypothetical protein
MTAPAHIVYGSPSIYQLVVDADLVVRARIIDPSDQLVAAEPAVRRPAVVATALQVYKGRTGPGPIRFAQHGHGVAQYEVGDEALLFLRLIERTRELDEIAATGQVPWVSLQEHDSAFTLEPAARPAFDAALRSWVAAAAAGEPSTRLGSLREVTVGLLRSTEPRLARSALRDLVLMGDVLVTGDTGPALVSISNDTAIDIGLARAEGTGRRPCSMGRPFAHDPGAWSDLGRAGRRRAPQPGGHRRAGEAARSRRSRNGRGRSGLAGGAGQRRRSGTADASGSG